MPYISPEKVAEIRRELKEKFPKVKFSVTCRDYSGVMIRVMASPFKWEKDYQQINHFYPDQYENAEFLKEVIEVAQRENGVLVVDSDYGTVPNYYVNIQVGKWDRPHITI